MCRNGCQNCIKPKWQYWFYGCGVFWLLLALILGLLWPPLSLHILYSQLTLKEGSMNYVNWIETPIPMYLEIYMWNWTNTEDVYNHSIKPKFDELGPYVFKEVHERVDLDWHNENSTISFNQTRTWYFEPELSNGSLDDLVTNINVIATSAVYATREKDFLIRRAVNYILNHKNGTLFITKTVRELLFDGYDDPLLTFLKQVNSTAFNVPFDKFGWFVDRNTSAEYDGRFNMYTGYDDISMMGIVTTWNQQPRVPFYKDECGMINGTTGELWPPNIKLNQSVTVFATDVCRSVSLTYLDEVDYYGISAGRWVGDDKIFDNGIKYPENECFCTNKPELCPDLQPGVLNVSDCRYGAPAFVSYPHFYLADKSYVINVDGVSPNKSLHEFSMDVEPTTGIPFHVNARLQINVMLQPMPGIDHFANVPNLMTPMFWFRQTVTITEELAGQAKLALLLPSIGVWIAYGFVGIGGILTLYGVFLSIMWGRGSNVAHTRFVNETNHEEEAVPASSTAATAARSTVSREEDTDKN